MTLDVAATDTEVCVVLQVFLWLWLALLVGLGLKVKVTGSGNFEYSFFRASSGIMTMGAWRSWFLFTLPQLRIPKATKAFLRKIYNKAMDLAHATHEIVSSVSISVIGRAQCQIKMKTPSETSTSISS